MVERIAPDVPSEFVALDGSISFQHIKCSSVGRLTALWCLWPFLLDCEFNRKTQHGGRYVAAMHMIDCQHVELAEGVMRLHARTQGDSRSAAG